MKKEITLSYAKSHLSEVLDAVEQGESIIIQRNRKRIAVLSPLQNFQNPRKFGQWKGKIKLRSDFDELPEEILRAFDGLK